MCVSLGFIFQPFVFFFSSLVILKIPRTGWRRKQLGFALASAAASESPSEGGLEALCLDFLPVQFTWSFLLTLLVNLGFYSYLWSRAPFSFRTRYRFWVVWAWENPFWSQVNFASYISALCDLGLEFSGLIKPLHRMMWWCEFCALSKCFWEYFVLVSSYFSPLLKSIPNKGGRDRLMIGQDIQVRDGYIEALESRFLFLAADARSTLR